MNEMQMCEGTGKRTREKLKTVFDILKERISWEDSAFNDYKKYIYQYNTVYFFMKDRETGMKCAEPLLDVLKGKEVCFIDMNVENHGKEILAGIPCYGLERMFGSDWHTSVIVIAEIGGGANEIEKIIKEKGNQTLDKLKHAAICKNYAEYALKRNCDSYGLAELNDQDRDIRHFLYLEDKIYETFDALNDNHSQYILYRIVATRFLINDYTNANMVDVFTPDINFPKEICKRLTETEVLVDVGAYPGNVTVDFMHFTKNQFKKAYMLELDKENYRNMKSQKEFKNEGIVILNQGVADKNYLTEYIQRGNFHSDIIDNCASEMIEGCRVEKCVIKTLDSMKGEEIKDNITYMIISTPNTVDVLKGAESILKEDIPKLAIRVNDHRLSICNVILYLKNIVPEYKFFIRHHSDVFKRTVLYAVKE